MTKIDIVAGDAGYTLTFQLSNADGSAYDISGLTIMLKAQNQNASTLGFSGAMSITDGPNGKCEYQVQDGDFPDPGSYYAEIQVSGGGVTETFTDIIITAKKPLPRV